MAKQQWPATVKNVWYEDTINDTNGNAQIPLEIGQGQVAVLLALQFELSNYNEAAKSGRFWLLKNSQPGDKSAHWRTSGGWLQDTNVIDYSRGLVGATTSVSAYKVYPYPVLLIRSPSIVYDTNSTTMIYTLGLWYVLQNVTDKELTELMVKDHA